MPHRTVSTWQRVTVGVTTIALIAVAFPGLAIAKSDTSRAEKIESELSQGAGKKFVLDQLEKARGVRRIVPAAVTNDTNYVITFDAGDPIGGLPALSTLSNQYAASTGATFSGNAFSGASNVPGSSATTWATNTGMSIGLVDRAVVGPLVGGGSALNLKFLHTFAGDWLGENGNPSMRVDFAIPVSTFSATFAGISNGVAGTASGLIAYNAEGTVVAQVNATQRAFVHQAVLTVNSSAPIARVDIIPGSFNDWVGIDNISFKTVVADAVLVNDKVTMTTTSGAAGSTICTAPYTSDYVLNMNLKNISSDTLVNTFFKVRELDYTGSPAAAPLRLVSADAATCSNGGRVGAVQSVNVTGSTIAPGATVPVQFRIAMPEVRRMRFFVDVYAIVNGVPTITKSELVETK
jgi:hypothetical protein